MRQFLSVLIAFALATAVYSQPRVAVFPFDPVMDSLYAFDGKESILDYRKALQEMITTDLSKSPDIRIIETSEIAAFVKQQKLIPDRWSDLHLASQVATALGADYAVIGTYGEYAREIRVDARIIVPASAEVPPGYSATGTAKAWDDLPTAATQVAAEVREIIAANSRVRPVSKAFLYPEGDVAAFGLVGDAYTNQSRLVVRVNAPAPDIQSNTGIAFDRCDRLEYSGPNADLKHDWSCKMALLPAGEVRLTVSGRGFLPYSELLTLAAGKAYRLEVTLQPVENIVR